MTQTITPPARANLGTAPAVLNTNDRAMWVTGWNECLDALAVSQPQQDAEQSVFEEWLASKCPSGDVEAVERQWEASSEYADFHNPPIPADAQTVRDAAFEEAAALCDEQALKNGQAVSEDEPDDIISLRSAAWQLSVTAAAIRALKGTASAPAADELMDAARFSAFRSAFERNDQDFLDRVHAGVFQLGLRDGANPTAAQINTVFDAAMQADAGKESQS